MLDIKLIRECPELVRHSIRERRLNSKIADIDELLRLDSEWRDLQTRADAIRSERNTISNTIGKLSPEERQAAVEHVRKLKDELTLLETQVERLKTDRDALLKLMPNLLAEDVPQGGSDAENKECSRWGEPKTFSFSPRDHVELGRITDTIDFDRGAKVAGSNFYYLKNEAVMLEFALLQYAMHELVADGFIPVLTPDLARDDILEGIGFSPRGPETQVYSIQTQNLSLVGTAEITLGGYHADEILEASSLPIKYLGFSHCFRTEAGTYGKESRGLYRVHQFTKAEMFILSSPEASPGMHEYLREKEESLVRGLGLAYRVVNVCAGDLGAPAAKKYDIEAWMPGRNAFGEVTSCSNCTDFQSRRLNIRYRPDAKASPRWVHLLNGTAIAVSRILLAIYENYQEADGSIRIPEPLRPWIPVSLIPARRV